MQQVYENLRFLMAKLSISQEALAKRVECSQSTISKLVNGKGNAIGINKYNAIAQAMGLCDAGQLFDKNLQLYIQQAEQATTTDSPYDKQTLANIVWSLVNCKENNES